MTTPDPKTLLKGLLKQQGIKDPDALMRRVERTWNKQEALAAKVKAGGGIKVKDKPEGGQ